MTSPRLDLSANCPVISLRANHHHHHSGLSQIRSPYNTGYIIKTTVTKCISITFYSILAPMDSLPDLHWIELCRRDPLYQFKPPFPLPPKYWLYSLAARQSAVVKCKGQKLLGFLKLEFVFLSTRSDIRSN